MSDRRTDPATPLVAEDDEDGGEAFERWWREEAAEIENAPDEPGEPWTREDTARCAFSAGFYWLRNEAARLKREEREKDK